MDEEKSREALLNFAETHGVDAVRQVHDLIQEYRAANDLDSLNQNFTWSFQVDDTGLVSMTVTPMEEK